MHAEVMQFLRETFTAEPPKYGVLEIGSRNINGSARDVIAGVCGECLGTGSIDIRGEGYPCSHRYHGVDLVAGPGVDQVVDGPEVDPPFAVDVVISCEVFEHTTEWPEIVENAFGVLMPGGRLVVTMATTGRAPHSAVDGGALRDGEFYSNVELGVLVTMAEACGFTTAYCRSFADRGDLYAIFRKPAK